MSQSRSRRRLGRGATLLALTIGVGFMPAAAQATTPAQSHALTVHSGFSAAAKAAAPKRFANCTALNKVYPHGVGKTGARDKVSGKTRPVTKFKVDTRLYNAQKATLDRDKDGIACEKH